MLAGDAMQALAFEVLTPDDGERGGAARAAGASVRAAGAGLPAKPGWRAGRRSTWPTSGQSHETSATCATCTSARPALLLRASVQMGAACGGVHADSPRRGRR
jgi:farnesyl diphosphate synthase